MSDITQTIAAGVAARLDGTLGIQPVLPRHITNSAEVIRGYYSYQVEAINEMIHITYCALRWKLFCRAKFTPRKLRNALHDDQPLRFIIPFIFCEPFGRWYKFAPFVVVLEKTTQAHGLVNIYAETQQIPSMDNGRNIRNGPEQTNIQVVMDCTTIVPARFNIAWSPWRAAQ